MDINKDTNVFNDSSQYYIQILESNEEELIDQ